MQIPDYLIINIIAPIIDYLLLKDNTNNNNYLIKRFIYTKDEIINLSLVSNKWFNIISNLISNNIKNNLHNWVNLECGNYINKRGDGGEIHNILEINKPFSIIKIEESEISNYYNKKLKVIYGNILDKNNEIPKYLLNSYEKIINNINQTRERNSNQMDQQIINLLKLICNNSNNKNNIEFNIFIALESSEKINKIMDQLEQGKITNIINNLEIEGSGNGFDEDDESDVIRNQGDIKKLKRIIEKLKPRNLELWTNGYEQDSLNHLDYTWLFETESESIKIECTDHIEAKDFSKLNNPSSKLHSFSFHFLFHDMIKLIRQEILNQCFSNSPGLSKTDSIIEDYNLMFEQLSNNTTIKRLSIANFCSSGDKCYSLKPRPCKMHSANPLNPNFCRLGNGTDCFQQRKKKQERLNALAISTINNGFKLLFSKNKQIKYLKLSSLEFINEIGLSGLIESSSIKTLCFKSTYSQSKLIFDYLITDVLTLNKSIKNLIIKNDILPNIFKLLLKHQVEISNLYSVKFIVTYNQLESLIELISSPLSTIKEFNLIYKNTDDDEDNEISTTQFKHLIMKNLKIIIK